MDAYEYRINQLTKGFTPRELAEQFLASEQLVHTYSLDNTKLREENESLRYLIAKYRMNGKEQ